MTCVLRQNTQLQATTIHTALIEHIGSRAPCKGATTNQPCPCLHAQARCGGSTHPAVHSGRSNPARCSRTGSRQCVRNKCRKRLQSGWSSAAITAVSCSPAASSTTRAVPHVRCRSSSSAKAPHGTITLSPSAPPPSFFSASLPSIAASADAVVAGAEARWGARQGFKGQRRLMHRLAEAARHRPADAALACHGWC